MYISRDDTLGPRSPGTTSSTNVRSDALFVLWFYPWSHRLRFVGHFRLSRSSSGLVSTGTTVADFPPNHDCEAPTLKMHLPSFTGQESLSPRSRRPSPTRPTSFAIWASTDTLRSATLGRNEPNDQEPKLDPRERVLSRRIRRRQGTLSEEGQTRAKFPLLGKQVSGRDPTHLFVYPLITDTVPEPDDDTNVFTSE